MKLNDAGHMVHKTVANISNFYADVYSDSLIVMPDHVHAVLVLYGGRTRRSAPTDVGIPAIIKNIKTYTTRRYIQGVHTNHWQPFYNRLWQRGYYEHIIRNEGAINRVREYIMNNPISWSFEQKH